MDNIVIIFLLPAWFRGTKSSVNARKSEQPFRAAQSWLLLKEHQGRRNKWFCNRGRLSEEMVFTRKRPIEPTWGILQDVWISLTLLLESRSMSQARLPGFLPACLPCHGAVIPRNPPAPAPARAPSSSGCSSESYKDCHFLGLGDVHRGTAILGSLILEGLPHILPEGERNKQLCTSRSLRVHGETKEKRRDIWLENFPGNKIPNSCRCPHAPSCLQAIQMSSWHN